LRLQCRKVYFWALAIPPPLAVDTYHQPYKGSHFYKIDPKNRVSVYPAWRGDLGAPLYLQLVKEFGLPAVRVLSEEAYQRRVMVVRESDKTEAEKNKLLAKFALYCHDSSINEQGKLLIPKDLAEQAEIQPDSDVVLAGGGAHFQVWSRVNFDQYKKHLDTENEDDEFGLF
jgi:DNA-binding transcriptional regulator/RsmH inhibitor MraZ